MDLTSFAQASVAGVPLVLVVIGCVYWFKQFKGANGEALFSGNVLLLVSMGWGLVLGGGYMVVQTRPPAEDAWVIWSYWFAVTIYGLAMGLVASGLYSTVRDIVGSTFANLFKGGEG